MTTESVTGRGDVDPERLAVNGPDERVVSFEPIGDYAAVVVDNYYRDPSYVREVALSLNYVHNERRGAFPGHEATLPVSPEPLARLAREFVEDDLVLYRYFADGYVFSAMTRQVGADQWTENQRPHLDVGQDFAGLVYLNPPGACAGGTGFYRNRATGLASIPESLDDPTTRELMRERGLTTAGELMDFVHRLCAGEPGATPSNAWADEWEMIKLLEMKFNRLVLYPSVLFHRAVVPPGAFGETLETRRLTQTFFFILRDSPAGEARPA